MVFVPRPRIEQFRSIFLLVFLVLVVTMIFTPLFVQKGLFLFAEETLEAILLLVQITLAWRIFRLYEKAVMRREEEIQKLEREYQKREKELLETFAYLGKVNVQMSMIKSFLRKMNVPTDRKELKEYIEEILRLALSLSRKNWMTLRIVHPEKFQTLSEYWVRVSQETKIDEIRIGNKEIMNLTKDKKRCNEKGYCVLRSTGSASPKHKAFLVFLNGEKIDQEIMDFLEAAVNQCEIIYTLFKLRQSR